MAKTLQGSALVWSFARTILAHSVISVNARPRHAVSMVACSMLCAVCSMCHCMCKYTDGVDVVHTDSLSYQNMFVH